MAFRTLISAAALAPRLPDPHVVVVDCRYKLDDEAWGAAQYRAAHVPGAVYAHLGHDLAGPKTGTSGRHPLPDPDALRATFGRLGIADGVQVVAYDQDSGMYASRLWWMLRWMGHDAAAVLDGGFARWTAEGRPTASGDERREPRTFTGSPHADMVVDAAAAGAAAQAAGWRAVDARAPERYRGDIEPLDRVAGHIPGAVNHFFMQNLDEGGTFRSPEDLRARLQPAIGDTPADHIVNYCGSGVTACHNLLALEHAGIRGAKLYPGSWSEWSSDAARPIEKG
jgi:thiosulfate/3-mercaptopyruvate sulfurtransferase